MTCRCGTPLKCSFRTEEKIGHVHLEVATTCITECHTCGSVVQVTSKAYFQRNAVKVATVDDS